MPVMSRSHLYRRTHGTQLHSRTGQIRPHGGIHALLAFDICAFGDPGRTQEDRIYLRSTMYGLVEAAFAHSGLPWEYAYREDRGDGILLALPGGLATALLVDPLVGELRALLHEHNRRAGEGSRLRLRMSLDAGHVTHDGYGLVGRAANKLHRALDAPAFKSGLLASSADLGVIVSDFVFDEVVSGLIDAEAYRPVEVEVKETRARAWACFPHGTWTPALPPVRLVPRPVTTA
ncbi:hypothetical protein GCM10009550_07360 [Actinocorallia libanotica]|uniref:Guanylate cyclase domain-containing protein n=2 Tax=Actinocorallia libanotica TaxID=46162 RepID=A0ABN1Q946_9ACTN